MDIFLVQGDERVLAGVVGEDAIPNVGEFVATGFCTKPGMRNKSPRIRGYVTERRFIYSIPGYVTNQRVELVIGERPGLAAAPAPLK